MHISKIPKIIFQTQKSQQYVNQTKLLLEGQNSWKAFFDDKDKDRFMREYFDEKVNEAYNRCPIPVMKADIWRYCVIYMCQWLFSAPPRSPILKSVIDLIVKRFEEMPVIKGAHVVHHLTGPGVFTEGVEIYLKNNGYNIQKNKEHYVDSPVSIIGMMMQKKRCSYCCNTKFEFRRME